MSACPDHDRQESGRLKLNTQFPYLLNARSDQANYCPDGCIWIAILALCMSPSGLESTSSGRLHQSSLIWTWNENLKLIDHWTSFGRAAETSGRMQACTEASRYSEGFGRKYTLSGRICLICLASGRYGTSSRQMEQWTDERPNGMTRRPDGWQGTEINFLENFTESSWRT